MVSHTHQDFIEPTQVSEVIPKVSDDLWTRHLPPQKSTVRFWSMFSYVRSETFRKLCACTDGIFTSSTACSWGCLEMNSQQNPTNTFWDCRKASKKIKNKKQSKPNLLWKKIISTIHFQLHHAPLAFTCFHPAHLAGLSLWKIQICVLGKGHRIEKPNVVTYYAFAKCIVYL